MSNKNDIFCVRHLTKSFGEKCILNDISFSIHQGEIFGIIGPSGSGKTTLLKTLIGFLVPESGRVMYSPFHLVDSFIDTNSQFNSVYSYQKSFKQLYGFASQTPSFYSYLSVKENLLYFGSLYGLNKASLKFHIKKLLDLFELSKSENNLAKNLSGGMQRRLDIACALVHNPKILFLDEPTADLDPALSSKVWNLLRKVKNHGTTIILASHHLKEMHQLCNRVAFIQGGKIAYIGTPSEVASDAGLGEVVSISSSPGNYERIISVLSESGIDGISNYLVKDRSLFLKVENYMLIPKILDGVESIGEKVTDLTYTQPKLDEAFYYLTKNNIKTNRIKQNKNKIVSPKISRFKIPWRR